MEGAIEGAVDNGRRAQVDLSFYAGEVGVRERGATLELAWFGKPPAFAGSAEGTLDGVSIRVIDVRSRDLTGNVPLRRRGSAIRAVTAIAELVNQAG